MKIYLKTFDDYNPFDHLDAIVRDSGHLRVLDKIIQSQDHEWKPISLVWLIDAYENEIIEIEEWSNSGKEKIIENYKKAHVAKRLIEKLDDERIKELHNEAQIHIEKHKLNIALLNDVLSDDMKDIWLWIKNKLMKVRNIDKNEINSHFGLYGNRVYSYIEDGLEVNKWKNFSTSDLKEYVEEIIRSLKMCTSKIKNSPIDLHFIDLIKQDERDSFISNMGYPGFTYQGEIEREEYFRYLPHWSIQNILSAYITHIDYQLSMHEGKRTYFKPRSGMSDKFVRRDVFVNSMYDLTTEDFGSPCHDFVANISSILLKDYEINSSIVRGIYNRRV